MAGKISVSGGTRTGEVRFNSSNAEINLRAGATGTSGAVNWTFNTNDTNYASLKLDYDTRASTGFHIDAGYPITIDASSSTGIKFVVNTTAIGNFTSSGLYVGTGNEVQIVPSGSSLFPSIKINNNGYLGSASATGAIQILTTGQVKIANNNDDYNFKAMAGDADSWFGVYDDANNSANIIVTRSDTTESFRHKGHNGETTIKATGTGLRVESTSNDAIQIVGNSGGLKFVTGANQRIYFGSLRAVEGNSGASILQIGEHFNTTLFQSSTKNEFYGHVVPNASNTFDLGSSTHPWRDLYIGDLKLSNETREEGNDIDGTKGNWTIQEGESNLYIINNKNGKKYRFALEEV